MGARVVVVADDSAVDRKVAGEFVRQAGFEPVFAQNGEEALARVEAESPVLVLTDLQMPVMSGLDLVRALKTEHPTVPAILMTGHGSEQIAVEALRAGAAHYVPKRHLATDLPQALEAVLEAVAATREMERVRDCLADHESRYVLDNDPATSRALVNYLQASLRDLCLCKGADLVRLGTALKEALDNAIDHGNLELDSALREDSFQRYHEEGQRRRQLAPYAGRRVRVTVSLRPEEARFVVEDEGKGFDVDGLPDPRDPENLLRSSGRGVMLIRTFMDEVSFNDRGNEITMVLRHDAREPQ